MRQRKFVLTMAQGCRPQPYLPQEYHLSPGRQQGVYGRIKIESIFNLTYKALLFSFAYCYAAAGGEGGIKRPARRNARAARYLAASGRVDRPEGAGRRPSRRETAVAGEATRP